MGCLVLNANSSEPARSKRSRILLKNGFEVAEAATPAEVLPIAVKLRPSVVVASVPIGPDAPELWRRLRACGQTQNIPMVLTFASAETDSGQNRDLADVWLPEPVGPDALISVIRMLLASAPCGVGAAQAVGKSAEPGPRTGEAKESVRSTIGYASRGPQRVMRLPEGAVSLETVHDLMSPLSTLTAISSWIASEYGAALDQNGREYLDLLQKSIERMHKAMSALLDARPA